MFGGLDDQDFNQKKKCRQSPQRHLKRSAKFSFYSTRRQFYMSEIHSIFNNIAVFSIDCLVYNGLLVLQRSF